MPFYTYDQVNSGGGYDRDPVAGISEYVIIEATDAEHADFLAERIGLYFDGYRDCPCCGNRWYSQSAGGGTDAPEIYGEPVENYTDYWLSTDKVYAWVHYLNGEKKSFSKAG